jgi:competence protein ComEA
MHFSPTKMTPALAGLTGAIAMIVAVVASFIISGRANDGDVVIISDPAAFEIAVEVRGAIRSPGVYRLSQDARLDDLLTAAGGVTSDADLAPHNLARRLFDAEVVVIERIGSATPIVAVATEAPPQSNSYQININTATSAELETLPGIGPVLAQRIIDDRTANGPYRNVADLTRVSGISENLIDDIQTQITVGP